MNRIIDIDIDSSGFLQLQARFFRKAQADLSVLDRVRRLVGFVRGLSVKYAALLSNDGRLIGQERIELIRQLDEAIIELLGLRYILGKSEDFSIPVPRTKDSLQFNLQQDSIHGSGRLAGGLKLQKERFSDWLSIILNDRLARLLQRMGQAYSDAVLTNEETAALIKDVNLLFLGFLLSRESILRGQME